MMRALLHYHKYMILIHQTILLIFYYQFEHILRLWMTAQIRSVLCQIH
jgi:hypothetical protein